LYQLISNILLFYKFNFFLTWLFNQNRIN